MRPPRKARKVWEGADRLRGETALWRRDPNGRIMYFYRYREKDLKHGWEVRDGVAYAIQQT